MGAIWVGAGAGVSSAVVFALQIDGPVTGWVYEGQFTVFGMIFYCLPHYIYSL